MKRDYICWILLIVGATLNFISDYFAKIYVNGSGTKFLIYNQILWLITALIYVLLLWREKSMITSATSWTVLSLISFVVVGYLTGEVIQVRYVIATLLALIAVGLTSW